MRDALTLADQAISYCQGEISRSGVIDMLGVPEQAQVFELLSAMAKGISPCSFAGGDYFRPYAGLLKTRSIRCYQRLHRVAIAQAAPTAVDNSFGDKETVLKLAAEFAAEDIQLFYQLGAKGRGELRSGLDMRSAFEMLLLRMMIFSPSLVDQNLMPSQAGSDDSDQHSDQWRDGQSETRSSGRCWSCGRSTVSEFLTASNPKKKTLADQHESDAAGAQHEFARNLSVTKASHRLRACKSRPNQRCADRICCER